MTTLGEEVFRKMLEYYVLRAINELDVRESNLFEQGLASSVFTSAGETWVSYVERMMDFGDEMPATIKKNWVLNRDLARKKGVQLAPHEFARQFVQALIEDTN